MQINRAWYGLTTAGTYMRYYLAVANIIWFIYSLKHNLCNEVHVHEPAYGRTVGGGKRFERSYSTSCSNLRIPYGVMTSVRSGGIVNNVGFNHERLAYNSQLRTDPRYTTSLKAFHLFVVGCARNTRDVTPRGRSVNVILQ